MHFSPRSLKARRIAAGVSITELAARIDRSYPLILSYEKGRTYPSIPALAALAGVLNCDIGDLFEPDDDPVDAA